nr:hypothetical protein [Nonomuraea sp. SBT364]
MAELDGLIDDRLLFTGPDGRCWFLGTLEGAVNGEPFRARVRYTRTWIRDGGGRRLIAAHVGPAGADQAPA